MSSIAEDPEKEVDPEKGPDLNPSDVAEDKRKQEDTDLDEGSSGKQPNEKQPEEDDPNIVWWNGPDDPENPMNWPPFKKYGILAILSFLTFITPLGSSMFAPGVPQVMREFHSSSVTLATFVVSVYILGFAFGPLIVAPLSEMYGRMPIYNGGNILFLIFTICAAVSKSMGMLIGFRFLQGLAGSTPITIGGGTIADCMPIETRGRVIAIWSMGPLLGPVVGPVAGGYLTQAAGWRWVFWLLAIVSGVASILCALLLRETYAPVILERKAARLRKETGNQDLRSKLDNGLTKAELFARSIIRPIKLLVLSPIVFLISLYVAVAYGVLYLLFTTYTFVFEEYYGFAPGSVGLTYIPSGIGMLIGMFILGIVSDHIIKQHKAAGHTLIPEMRLSKVLTIPGGILLPIGLFIYGWTAQHHIHWIVPLIGTAFVGAGIMGCMIPTSTYLIDAFQIYAASAIAANGLMRSLLGALLPLGGLKMYERLGLGWGNSLLAFVALGLIPVPVVFRIFGERIRARYPLKL